MLKIYVASSWRNAHQPSVVSEIRQYTPCEVYDFRNPAPGNHGFSWSQVDENYKSWSWSDWRSKVFSCHTCEPVATSGFGLDMNALRACDICVCVLPCGKSAHLELGWAAGAGKLTVIYVPPGEPLGDPELMYKMVDCVFFDLEQMIDWLRMIAEARKGLRG